VPIRTSESSARADLSVPEKVGLFRSLFRGREDVYALRWEKADGMSGYSPASIRDWKAVMSVPAGERKKLDQATRQLLPLTDEPVHQHLSGKNTLGIYPLLPDETCSTRSKWSDAMPKAISFNVQRLIAEVAAQLFLKPDDAAFALVTMKRLVLEESLEAIRSRVAADLAQFEASAQWAHKRAESAIAEEVRRSTAALRDEIQRDINTARLRAAEIVQEVRRPTSNLCPTGNSPSWCWRPCSCCFAASGSARSPLHGGRFNKRRLL
jgi:hypothetical protein